MKQKIVVEVCMRCDKCRTTAMSIAAVRSGVISVQIRGESRNQVTVIGEDVDSVSLTACLRKKIGSARLVSVEQVKDEGVNDNKDDKDKDNATILPCYCYTTARYYSQPRVYYCEPLYDSNPNCSIM